MSTSKTVATPSSRCSALHPVDKLPCVLPFAHGITHRDERGREWKLNLMEAGAVIGHAIGKAAGFGLSGRLFTALLGGALGMMADPPPSISSSPIASVCACGLPRLAESTYAIGDKECLTHVKQTPLPLKWKFKTDEEFRSWAQAVCDRRREQLYGGCP